VSQTGEPIPSLADKSLDELAAQVALLPEGNDQASLYHDEIVRRQQQADLDKATSGLIAERRKYSVVTILILGAAILAMAASILLQK
jgi:hypothetical protein